MFNAPIPGQSLTSAPKNYPWERPPETTDPAEAVKFHIEKLSDPDVLDNVVFLMEYGLPIDTLVKSFLTAGVARGVHTIDTSLLIAPVIHRFLVSAAEDVGINYKEEFSKDPERKELSDKKAILLFKKAFKAMPKEPEDPGYQLVKEVVEQPSEVKEATPAEKKPVGLMVKRST